MKYFRSLLFAPAVRPEMFSKLPSRGADAVIIDLEDAVPVARKAEARAIVAAEAPGLVALGCRVLVRVNAADSSWMADDVATGLVAGLTAVVVPKIETMVGVEAATDALDAAGHHDLGIVAGIETALGVADARLEQVAEEGGLKGKIAEAAHHLVDKLDND